LNTAIFTCPFSERSPVILKIMVARPPDCASAGGVKPAPAKDATMYASKKIIPSCLDGSFFSYRRLNRKLLFGRTEY
jgi:hypothetical protein